LKLSVQFVPQTDEMSHLLENIGAPDVQFMPAEIAALNQSVRGIEIQGQRLPDPILMFSGVEAPPKVSNPAD
jgi:hypothetical protein